MQEDKCTKASNKWMSRFRKKEKQTEEEEAKRYKLLMQTWQKCAPIPWNWPHDELFESWCIKVIPALFETLAQLQARKEERIDDE